MRGQQPPPQQQQQHINSMLNGGNFNCQRSRQEALLSMRKHHSLDGAQFLSQFENLPPTTAVPPPPSSSIANNAMGPSSIYSNEMNTNNAYYRSPEYANFNPYSMENQMSQQQQQQQYPQTSNAYNIPFSDDDIFGAQIKHYSTFQNPSTPLTYNSSTLNRRTHNFTHNSGGVGRGLMNNPSSYGDISTEYEMLKREFAQLNQKLNYVMDSIRTFWSPELKKERQLRKEEAMRINTLQYKLCQQANEVEMVRNELEKREKDIGQLLSDSDLNLVDMEEELRRLRKQFREPRDFTDQSLTLHEFQTMKAKMERSELALAEKCRDVQNLEVRLKCSEEQLSEINKRNEILQRSNLANESQSKLLNDDLNVLRKKLETKNQLLESREKTIKNLEKELDTAKNQLQESAQTIQENDHRISQMNYRIDQFETLIRDRESQIDRLKQRLMQQTGTRVEAELQQRLENVEQDKSNLEKLVDSLRQNNEIEKQNQLQTFQEENRQLHSTIEYLQKELSDRHMLISSQNEKISQLDIQSKKLTNTDSLNASKTNNENTQKNLELELDEAQKEVERLLRIVQTLEKEKSALGVKLNDIIQNRSPDDASSPLKNKISDLLTGTSNIDSSSTKNDNNLFKIRIEELEEALRESVGITAERDKIIGEQKILIQQLSSQVSELYTSGKNSAINQVDQRTLQNATAKAEASQNALNDEKIKFQRQLINLKKENTMALINEKESFIQLLQLSPESIKDKVDELTRQKEQLKHKLLSQDVMPFNTSEFSGWQNLENAPNSLELAFGKYLSQTNAGGMNFGGGFAHSSSTSYPYSNVYPGMTAPINISVPPASFMGFGASAPASLTYGRDDNNYDDGIWA